MGRQWTGDGPVMGKNDSPRLTLSGPLSVPPDRLPFFGSCLFLFYLFVLVCLLFLFILVFDSLWGG